MSYSQNKLDTHLKDGTKRIALYRFGTKDKTTHKTFKGPRRWVDSRVNTYVAFSRFGSSIKVGQNIYSDLV